MMYQIVQTKVRGFKTGMALGAEKATKKRERRMKKDKVLFETDNLQEARKSLDNHFDRYIHYTEEALKKRSGEKLSKGDLVFFHNHDLQRKRQKSGVVTNQSDFDNVCIVTIVDKEKVVWCINRINVWKEVA